MLLDRKRELLSLKVVTLILSITALFGAVAFLSHDSRWSNRRNTHDTETRGPARSQTDPLRGFEVHAPFFRLVSQHRYIYAFDRSIELSGLGESNPRIHYRGHLNLDVVRSDSRGFEAAASIELDSPVSLHSESLLVRIENEGEQVSFASSSESASETKNILKDILLQWAFLSGVDTTGHYRFTLDENQNSFTKTKLAYANSANSPEILSSRHRMQWDEERGAPAEISGEENTRIGTRPLEITTRSSYKIVFTAFEAIPKAPDISRYDRAETPEIQPLSRKRYQVRSWESLLPELQSIGAMAPGERLRVLGDLAPLLRGSPESIANALSLLRSQGAIPQGLSSALFSVTLGALAAAGTAEAQAAMIQVYQDPDCPLTGKGAILSAFTTSQSALAPGTRDFLASEMNSEDPDLAHAASYAMGASLQSPSDSASGAIVSQVAERWAQASSSGDTTEELTLLDTMGNSGRSEFLAPLSEVINGSAFASASASSPVLRAKALFALRFIPDAAAQQILEAHQNDPIALIQQASIDALAARDGNIKTKN